MKHFIHQKPLKLIIFLVFSGFFNGCIASSDNSSIGHLKSYEKVFLELPSGEKIYTYIAKTESQQRLGLSKIESKDFSNSMGMLFPEDKMRVRQFWMPETHFDLDVFFMNEDYYILDIHRNLKHSKDRSNAVYSKEVFSQHVLELKSSSPLAKKIKPGMILKLTKKAQIP